MRGIQVVVISTSALIWAFSALAETQSPSVKHFAASPIAKSVKPPPPGTKKFLTIQIDPEEQRRALAAAAQKPFVPVTSNAAPATGTDTAKAPAAASPYEWYWGLVSPKLDDRAGRMDAAIAALSNGPKGKAVSAPRLQHLQDIAREHGSAILQATIGTEVSPALVLAVIATESNGKVDAVSSAGAMGLMQLIPATAERFAVTDRADPLQNIKGGVAYLDWLMKEFDRDPLMVIAAYNAGENAVKKNGGIPPYAETRGYVPKVLAAWNVARGLCKTWPELVSDGCVFAVKG